uniref:probable membrane-associated kinase regulator 4 n=1 Tax=Erigeron canadensis TaxID=72917 RepID=UPI001CB89292|nr:probable membrane-associated kinase regulator 4 [Erigeron canadensis]
MPIDSVLNSIFNKDVKQEDEEEEEEYIDMEVSTFKNLLCHSSSNEFEFQMFSSSSDRELTSTSPADELFYKGKLLPLHLPPRLQMVEKILQDKNKDTFDDEFFSTPLATSTYATPIETTPIGSCNISPSTSCQVSRELKPEDYLFLDDHKTESPKKSWTKKLTLTKQSSFGSKLKASRDYLKSFFGKSLGGSDESRNKVSRTSGKKIKEKLDSNIIVNRLRHRRRSFSGAIKRFSMTTTNISHGPSSSISNSSSELEVYSRRINTSSEIENQIQSAIAHCKRSQQQLHSRNKTISDLAFCSLAASRVVCDDQDRHVLCRG